MKKLWISLGIITFIAGVIGFYLNYGNQEKSDTKIETKNEVVVAPVQETPSEEVKENPINEGKAEEAQPLVEEKKEEVSTNTTIKSPTTETNSKTTAPTSNKTTTTTTPKPTTTTSEPTTSTKPTTSTTPTKPEPTTSIETTVRSIDLYNLFQMRTDSALTSQQRLDAYNDTQSIDEMKYYTIQLNREYPKYIQGSFSWDYRNKNNRANFLAFRGGKYWYDNSSLSADKLYDKMYQKVQDHKLIIQASISYSEKDVFVHPTRGGYTVYGVLSMKYHSDNGSVIKGYEPDKWYSVRYLPDFNFKTLSSTDNWPRWNYGDYGLLIAGLDYRAGSFK